MDDAARRALFAMDDVVRSGRMSGHVRVAPAFARAPLDAVSLPMTPETMTAAFDDLARATAMARAIARARGEADDEDGGGQSRATRHRLTLRVGGASARELDAFARRISSRAGVDARVADAGIVVGPEAGSAAASDAGAAFGAALAELRTFAAADVDARNAYALAVGDRVVAGTVRGPRGASRTFLLRPDGEIEREVADARVEFPDDALAWDASDAFALHVAPAFDAWPAARVLFTVRLDEAGNATQPVRVTRRTAPGLARPDLSAGMPEEAQQRLAAALRELSGASGGSDGSVAANPLAFSPGAVAEAGALWFAAAALPMRDDPAPPVDRLASAADALAESLAFDDCTPPANRGDEMGAAVRRDLAAAERAWAEVVARVLGGRAPASVERRVAELVDRARLALRRKRWPADDVGAGEGGGDCDFEYEYTSD